MDVREMISNFMEKRRQNQQAVDDMDDDVTTDKHLRSLRRERRMQRESVEKEVLKKKIAEFKKKQMQKHLFGLKENAPPAPELVKKHIGFKQRGILQEPSTLTKSPALKKKRMKDSHSWMGKSTL